MSWTIDAANAQYMLDAVSKQRSSLLHSKAFTAFPRNEVLRVIQFDAITTQQEFMEILKSGLFQIFNIPPLQSFRYAYQEELVLLLELALYRGSTWRLGQSAGDRLHNLVLRDENRAQQLGLHLSSSLIPRLAPSRRLLLIHVIFSILIPYAVRKLQHVAIEEGWERDESASVKRRIAQACRYAVVGWSVLSLVNTLHFLATGQYRSLLERLLSLKVVYGSQTMTRLAQLVYLEQHMWWTSWASLLSLLRVGTYFNRLYKSARSVVSGQPSLLQSNDHICCVCKETPSFSQRSNCGHVYCYYCIKCRLLDCESTGSFRCLQCGQAVHSCTPAH